MQKNYPVVCKVQLKKKKKMGSSLTVKVWKYLEQCSQILVCIRITVDFLEQITGLHPLSL